jgi:hypothetical protein
MFPIEWFRQFLFWCSLPLLLLLGLTLVRQRIYRELPLFFSYVAITALSTSVRLIVYIISRPFLDAHSLAYSYTYWISSFVGSVLGFLAVYEIFVKRLFAGYYKVRFFRYLFPTVAVTITVIAIMTAVFSPDEPGKAWISATDRVLVLIRVILLGFFTFLMIVMGREWTRAELAIAFGFGVIAAASFFSSAVRPWFQNLNKDSLVSQLPTIAWDIACLIWLVAFMKRRKITEETTIKPINPEVLDDAKKWEGTLKGWLSPTKKRP